MKLYAETGALRLRQLGGDLAVALWVAAWLWAGRSLYELIERLAGPGRTVEAAGNDFAGNIAGIQERIGRVPVVGDELRGPVGNLGEVGRSLARAGVAQQDAVHDLALWLGVLIAALPILTLLLVWAPRRVRWMREAGAAVRLGLDADDLYLLALRAVANRSLRQLRRATPDPARALASGDYAPLAELELRALGLRAGAAGRGRPNGG